MAAGQRARPGGDLHRLSGTAYAVDGPLAGQNTVGSQDIINGEVQNQDIGPNAVGSGKIADGNVLSADVLDNNLTANDIANTNTLGTAEISEGDLFNDNSLNGDDIDSLTGGDVQDGSLTGGDISEGSVAGIDLANFAVGTLQLANLGVTRAKIADGAVGNTQIAPFSLLNNRIGSAQVDNRTLATGAVNSRAILNGAVAAADLATINTRTSTETIEASTVNLVTANCAVGEILLGGGENWLELGDTEIIESHRTSGQGWAVRVVNLFQEGDLDFRAEAYCLAL